MALLHNPFLLFALICHLMLSLPQQKETMMIPCLLLCLISKMIYTVGFPSCQSVSLSDFSPATFNLGHFYFFSLRIFLLHSKQLIPLSLARRMNSLC